MSDLIDFPSARLVKHELRRRALTVETVERLSPCMIRVALTGEDLADFASAAPDDHVKCIFDTDDGPAMRDYTPRSFDPAARRLVIDFAVHQAGPATAWALQAAPGDALTVGGPRGSKVIEGVEDWVLVGDETALPAIGRRIEEAPAGTRILSIVAVPDPADRQEFATAAAHRAIWVHRPAEEAADPAPLLAALAAAEIGPRSFVWIAAEAGVARALRAHLLDERGHPKPWSKSAGYWTLGQADAADKSLD